MTELAPAEGEHFRHFLRRVRHARGLTQVEVAGLLGVDRTTVHSWEWNGFVPQVAQAPKLAQFLGISARQLWELLGLTYGCGTARGHSRHLRLGEEPCEACLAACRERGQASRFKLGAAQPWKEIQATKLPLRVCSSCGGSTVQYRWCDACMCAVVNAKGRRCRNAASADGKCDYHAATAGQLAV